MAMKEINPLDRVDVIGATPKRKGLMRRLREEFDKETDQMSIVSRMRTRALGDKQIQRAMVRNMEVALASEMEAFVEQNALEAYERRANATITKQEIYNQLMEKTQEQRKQSTVNLASYAISTFEASQRQLVTLFDSRKRILDDYEARVADGAMSPEEFNKVTASIVTKADTILEKLEGAIDTFYDEIIVTFVNNVQNFSANYKEKTDD